MRLCSICHRREVNSPQSGRCRPCHREYCLRHYGSRRASRRAKALAWLRSAPRTSRQIADLLGITPVNAATMLYQLRRAGRVVAEGSPLRYRAIGGY